MMTNIPNLDELIRMALLEDVGDGDHSTLACIPPTATNSAKMVAKQDGVLCGMEVGEHVLIPQPSLHRLTFCLRLCRCSVAPVLSSLSVRTLSLPIKSTIMP